MILAPSILAADFSKIEQELKELDEYKVKWVHLDVMDGKFVPNVTFDSKFVREIRPLTKMFFDVHLMIMNPLKEIKKYVDAGAELITIHHESADEAQVVIDLIKSYGIKTGISIKPNTEVNEIKHLLDKVDLVLIMSVEPGKGGQSFILKAIDKIKQLKGGNYLIEVDGGINEETAKLCLQAGADVLVAGTYVFKDKNNIKVLNNLDY